MKNIGILITLIACCFNSTAQDTTTNWKLYPSDSNLVLVTDTVKGVVESKTPGTVKVVKDNRIDKVSKDLAGGENQQASIKGYRVEIVSNSNKSTVDSEKGRFMSQYPGVGTYTDYKAPKFKVTVGDFRTKLDAQKFQNEILKQFPNTLIIQTDIQLPRLD